MGAGGRPFCRPAKQSLFSSGKGVRFELKRALVRRTMNGILNILKPPGMTSFDVVGYLRGVTKIKKIGHTGTLDPGAVGVLPICIGSATKAIEYMTDKDKVYRAEMTLGVSTDTQDSSGQILEQKPVNVTSEEVSRVVTQFIGKLQQVPPMYSAIKVEGKKLYELARSGITVERMPREIEVYSINIIKNIDEKGKGPKTVILDVHCSKGTYIRTLCHDIGEQLGCGGHMSFLVRLKAGSFTIASALTLQEVASLHHEGRLYENLLSPDQVFDNLSAVQLEEVEESRFLNGVYINLREGNHKEGDSVRVYDRMGKFLAVGEVISKQGLLLLKSKKVF